MLYLHRPASPARCALLSTNRCSSPRTSSYRRSSLRADSSALRHDQPPQLPHARPSIAGPRHQLAAASLRASRPLLCVCCRRRRLSARAAVATAGRTPCSAQPAPSLRSPMPSRRRTTWRAPWVREGQRCGGCRRRGGAHPSPLQPLATTVCSAPDSRLSDISQPPDDRAASGRGLGCRGTRLLQRPAPSSCRLPSEELTSSKLVSSAAGTPATPTPACGAGPYPFLTSLPLLICLVSAFDFGSDSLTPLPLLISAPDLRTCSAELLQ